MNATVGQLARGLDRFSVPIARHGGESGFPQVLTPFGDRPLSKLMEIERAIHVFQVFVKYIRIRSSSKKVGLRLQELAVNAVGIRHRLSQEIDKGASLCHAGTPVVKLPDLKLH